MSKKNEIDFNYGSPLSPDEVDDAIEQIVAADCKLAVCEINTKLTQGKTFIDFSKYTGEVWEITKGMFEDAGWEIKSSLDNEKTVVFKRRNNIKI